MVGRIPTPGLAATEQSWGLTAEILKSATGTSVQWYGVGV
jgi:hypothetical protein